jgi:hypothetical protein
MMWGKLFVCPGFKFKFMVPVDALSTNAYGVKA